LVDLIFVLKSVGMDRTPRYFAIVVKNVETLP